MKLNVGQLIARLNELPTTALITIVDSEGYNGDLKLFAGDRVVAEQLYIDEESNGVFI